MVFHLLCRRHPLSVHVLWVPIPLVCTKGVIIWKQAASPPPSCAPGAGPYCVTLPCPLMSTTSILFAASCRRVHYQLYTRRCNIYAHGCLSPALNMPLLLD